ncbi:vacuolar protein sorting-associated protein 9A [Pelomyxa schiedti]|nr:vacuolar protein sorting-associated protein 9A [Pelomyxa schiedti]
MKAVARAVHTAYSYTAPTTTTATATARRHHHAVNTPPPQPTRDMAGHASQRPEQEQGQGHEHEVGPRAAAETGSPSPTTVGDGGGCQRGENEADARVGDGDGDGDGAARGPDVNNGNVDDNDHAPRENTTAQSQSQSQSSSAVVVSASALLVSSNTAGSQQQQWSAWLQPWSWWKQPYATAPTQAFYTKSEFEEVPPKLFDVFVSLMSTPECAIFANEIEVFLRDLDTDKCGTKIQSFVSSTFRRVASVLGNQFGAVLLFDCVEKYIMEKLYPRVFAPSSELEKDIALFNRIAKLEFIQPEHLDISPTIVNIPTWTKCGEVLFQLGTSRTPLGKILVIRQCCRELFDTLPPSTGADDFLSVLIFVLLRVNPPGLHSNIQYVLDFRSPDKMMAEAGYHVVSLYNAIAFIESVDASSLTIDPVVFNKNIGVFTGYIPPITEETWVVVTNRGSYVCPTLEDRLQQQAPLTDSTNNSPSTAPTKLGSLQTTSEPTTTTPAPTTHTEFSATSTPQLPEENRPSSTDHDIDSPTTQQITASTCDVSVQAFPVYVDAETQTEGDNSH